MTISALPTAPLRSMSPAAFVAAAEAWVAALATFVTEANALATACNTNETNAETAETAAELAQSLAESAYAAALAVSTATVYAAGTTYDVGDAVIGSNGLTYIRINSSGSGDNPVGSFTGNWQQVSTRGPTTEAHTTGATLTAEDLDGTVCHTNEGAAGEVELTFAAGADGLAFEAFVVEAQYLKLTADGTDVFTYDGADSAAGGYIRCNVAGGYVRGKWLGGKWAILEIQQTWSYDE